MAKKKMKCSSAEYGGSGIICGLGFLGALIYYISTANGFWNGILGVLKAIVWPLFLVYGLFGYMS